MRKKVLIIFGIAITLSFVSLMVVGVLHDQFGQVLFNGTMV